MQAEEAVLLQHAALRGAGRACSGGYRTHSFIRPYATGAPPDGTMNSSRILLLCIVHVQ